MTIFYLFTKSFDVSMFVLEVNKICRIMLKLLKCSVKLSEVNVCCARGFYFSVPLLGKAAIRRTWKKNTQKFLKRTEDILSGDSSKNKYASV